MAEENEKKDSSAVGKINNAIGKGRDIRRAYKIAKTGRTMAMAAEGAGALFSNPAGWVILGITLVLVIVIFVLFGGVSGVKGGDLSNNPTPPSTILPGGSPGPTTPPGPASNNITSWGKQISDNVRTFSPPCNTSSGAIYINNVMLQAVTNGAYTAHKKPGSSCGIASSSYYCSDLIIDSYNLSGIKVGFWEWVPNMISNWSSVAGLTVRKSNNVNGLQPGDAVFWLTNPSNSSTAQHVDMIYNINVSTSGNGTVTTVDTNTNSKFNTFYVKNWGIIGIWTDGANYPWFGLAPR